MDLTEPNSTAFLLTALGALMALSVVGSRLAGRAGVPVALLFIVIGIIAGSDGLGGIAFEDYGFAFRIGTVALVLILFDGGLNTPLSSVRAGIKPAALLATAGVVITAGITAVAGWLLGLPWGIALLLGAIVSSTDAAAVFSVLRGSGLHLKRRVGMTLELESGLNDPMAVILTLAMTEALIAESPSWGGLALSAVFQLVIGAALGFGVGYLGRELLRRIRVSAAGLYPVLTLSVAFLSFGLATLLQGSGFLAVYVTGVILGNGAIRYRSGVVRVHDAVAWFAQITMFLVLGLLVFPSKLLPVAWIGLSIGAALTFIARPVAVLACLALFGYTPKERLYVSWVGLRGAVPVILATFPVLANAPGATQLFNVVFFVVVVNALIPGATVPWLTRRLGLVADAPPPPQAVLEITSTHLVNGEVVGFHVGPASAACGARIAELPLPPSATVAMIVRGQELVAARGGTRLQRDDHLYVFAQSEDLPILRLLLGQQETD